MTVKMRWCVLAEGVSEFNDAELESWLAAAPPCVAMRVESTVVDETFGLDPVKFKNLRALQSLSKLFPDYSVRKLAHWFGLNKETLELVKKGRRNFGVVELTRIIVILNKKRPIPREVVARFRELQQLAIQKRK